MPGTVPGMRALGTDMLDRKTFLIDLAGAAGVLVFGGCGGGDGASAGPPMPAAGTCGAAIQDNHGHVLTIPIADLDSTTPRTYSIQGSADHSHNVTFSVAQLAQLKAGQIVSVMSTVTLSHSHAIDERCN